MDRLGNLAREGWFDDDEREELDLADMSVDDNPSVEIGADERRMHVRAYNHWVSLLNGRAYPAIADLDPENIADFGSHSVLLDFTDGIDDPAIRFLGAALREECALDHAIVRISEVPGRSLLSRLTDHYLQIIANCAPIGFEAEFVGMRGHNTMYRGILMPFSSTGDSIDFIYGVINWKELVDPATQAALDAEVAAAVRAAPRVEAPAAWADGPSASFTPAPTSESEHASAFAAVDTTGFAGGLADQLMLAQQSAAAVRAADVRSRAALYRALGRAYDFALATEQDRQGYQALLDQAGITVQARAPMTPIIKLVFGLDYDKTRVTEFSTVLDLAQRRSVPAGELGAWLDTVPGGIKGAVKAMREERRPADRPEPMAAVRAQLSRRPAVASVAVPTGVAPGDFVVLVARAAEHGQLDILASLEGDKVLTARALRQAAA